MTATELQPLLHPIEIDYLRWLQVGPRPTAEHPRTMTFSVASIARRRLYRLGLIAPMIFPDGRAGYRILPDGSARLARGQ